MQPDNGTDHIKQPEDLLPLVGQRITVHICPDDAPKMRRRYQLHAADPKANIVEIEQLSGLHDRFELPFANVGLVPNSHGHWSNKWIEASV